MWLGANFETDKKGTGDMKILMIGNGFDLEHGLPTKYTDFLDYIITFRGYYARVYQGQAKPRCDADKGDYFEKLFSDKKNHYKVEALQAMTKDNLWIDYFIKVREQHLKNKENWIDFESEISRIVQDLDEFQKIAGSSSRTEEYYHYKEKLREILEQEDLTPEAIPKTIDKLMLELNKLICALEIYLDDYVGGKKIILYNPDIAQIHPDNVISFNYTDTFRKVYGEYDTNTLPSFVHGIKNVFDKQERLASLRQENAQIETEFEYFKQYVEETDVEIQKLNIKKSFGSKQWMELWQECQFISEEKNRINFWFKIKAFFKYGVTNWKFYNQDISKIITTFQFMYYDTKKNELLREIQDIENYLDSMNENLLDNLCNDSMQILKDKLVCKYEKSNQRKLFTEEDLWKNPYELLQEYPVILSTTFSSRDSLNTDVVYDYLIMDEASQVDIATGALALSCARNVVIVGDTKQLPNVVTEEIKGKANSIFDSYHLNEGYRFTKSFLQSILEVIPNVTQTLLREHYRCHPKIINFCNQKFYRGELIIMTEDKGEKDVLSVIKTVPGNHERNHYSQRQIDVIKNEIIPKFNFDKNETGIIAPYKNQVKATANQVDGIDVDTVHKFQGKEKDNIIISTVDDEISDFADDPYLINVAVSRAKKKLILVVTGNEQSKESNIIDLINYIEYNNFEVIDSQIYSIFDYLYKQYSEERKEFLKNHKKISEYDSENLMYVLIEELLRDSRYSSLDVVCHFPMNMLIRNLELLNEQECKYAMNPATHIDFLIYNRISKKPVLAIEVDGYEYHKNGTVQAARDMLKNHILQLYQIPLLRFQTNGSGERKIIAEWLEKLVG